MSEQRTHYKQVSVTEYLPKKDGDYLTNAGWAEYYHKNGGFDPFSVDERIIWWLEPVALSSLLPEIVIPNENDIYKTVKYSPHVEGALWLLRQIKRLNPHLFPSTTKTDKT